MLTVLNSEDASTLAHPTLKLIERFMTVELQLRPAAYLPARVGPGTTCPPPFLLAHA